MYRIVVSIFEWLLEHRQRDARGASPGLVVVIFIVFVLIVVVDHVL